MDTTKISFGISQTLENPQQEPAAQPATTEAETYEDSEYSDFTEEQAD